MVSDKFEILSLLVGGSWLRSVFAVERFFWVVELTGAKLSGSRFEFRDDEFLDYWTVGVHTSTLVPVKFRCPEDSR